MSHLAHAALLAAAGAVGTLLRAGCYAAAARYLGAAFPWGTLVVNVFGSFAFGVIWSLARTRGGFLAAHEGVILVGLLGGFTTYSTFAFQSAELLGAGRTGIALAYVLGMNVAAIVAVWAGLRICGG